MSFKSKVGALESLAISAAYHALQDKNYVCVIDVFRRINILSSKNYEAWRQGRVPFLEQVIEGNLSKISRVMKTIRTWAIEQGLTPSECAYHSHGQKPKHKLQFSKSAKPDIEKAYRTHFISPKLREKKQTIKK